VERKERLVAVAARLPVDWVEFVPTDHLGKGLVERIRDSAGRVDVTPGTKGHTTALVRLARRLGWEIWSQHTGQGKVLRLDAGGDPSLPLVLPDLVTIAEVVGGPLAERPTQFRPDEDRREFLLRFGRFMEAYAREKRSASLPQYDCRLTCTLGTAVLTWQPGDQSVFVRLSSGVVGSGALWCGVVRSGGFWMEEVVAAGLAKSGCSEVIVGLKWQRTQEQIPRGELDVVARRASPRDHEVLAVSCKVAVTGSLAKMRREVEGLASFGLGRFTLPVVVVPVARNNMEQTVRASRGAVVLSLAAVLDERNLARTLDLAFQARRSAT